MPNIFKHLTRAKAQPYVFPDASELKVEEPEAPAGKPEEKAEEPEERLEETPAPDPRDPISFAQVQADKILEDAKAQAQQLLEQAKADAQEELEKLRQEAGEEGYQAGYQRGLDQAMKEGALEKEKQAAQLEGEVKDFLEKAGARLDRQMDETVDELRDLAIAIAEKVVCISLKSSSEVISRMVQAALDKRKRRDWVHIYIAECDAKRMAQVPASLTAALSAISDRVRIIPISDDESGTCVIEMPDEIVDASASTQLNNIKNLLMDTPAGDTGKDLNLL